MMQHVSSRFFTERSYPASRFSAQPVSADPLKTTRLHDTLVRTMPDTVQVPANSTKALCCKGTPLMTERMMTDLKCSVMALYPPDQVDEITQRIGSIIEEVKQATPPHLVQENLHRPAGWHKDEAIYRFYPDHLATPTPQKSNTFENLIGFLPYLKKLGVTTLYPLPFMSSPQGDGGFDVSDPKGVREDLGGLAAFEKFANEAHQQGFKIKADLVLNHLSDQHRWFQGILKGDLSKLDHFIWTDREPQFTRRQDGDKTMIDYREADGKITSRKMIFPGALKNHFRKESIPLPDGQKKDYWFYHSFYPFQLDMNWKNPKVLYHMLDAVGHWANRGVDIFRLDAMTYLMKEPGSSGEGHENNFEVARLLNTYLKAISPRSVLLTESDSQGADKVTRYFGQIHPQDPSKPVTAAQQNTQQDSDPCANRTDRVQMAYHFPMGTSIWASLISGDKTHVLRELNTMPKIPETAGWVNFLRHHDELQLAYYLPPATAKSVVQKLGPKGMPCREGNDVSGRVANLLDQDPKRIALAHSMLLTLPGTPDIYYGDEIAATNQPDFMQHKAQQRGEQARLNGYDFSEAKDSRDLHRGPIPLKAFDAATRKQNPAQKLLHRLGIDQRSTGQKTFQTMQTLLALRQQYPALRRGTVSEVSTDQPEVLAYRCDLPGEKSVLVVHHLANAKASAQLKLVMPQTSSKDAISGKPIALRTDVQNAQSVLTLQPWQSMVLPLS